MAKDQFCKISTESLYDFMWMSARYAVGRHTIHSNYHAGTIVKYSGYLSEDDKLHLADDIRNEISQSLHSFSWYVRVDGYGRMKDAASILTDYLHRNDISLNDKDFFMTHKFIIDTDRDAISVIDITDERELKDVSIYKTYFSFNLPDLEPWIKAANYLDKRCWRKVKLGDQEIYAFPWPECTLRDKVRIKWAPVEEYSQQPWKNIYIPESSLNFID